MLRRLHEDTACLAVQGCRGYHPAERFHKGWVGELPGHVHAGAQIERADEQDIHPRHGGDGCGVFHGFAGFDLRHAEQGTHGVFPIFSKKGSEARAPSPGRKPAFAKWSILHESHGLPRLFRILNIREHNAPGPQIQRPFGKDTIPPCDAHNGNSGVLPEGVQLVQQSNVVARPVFLIEENPVVSGDARQFRRERRAEVAPCPDDPFLCI